MALTSMAAKPKPNAVERRAITAMQQTQAGRWVAHALKELGKGVTKDVIREEILTNTANPFHRKIVEMAAGGFPISMIAKTLGCENDVAGIRKIADAYKPEIYGIQCAYSELATQGAVLEARTQMARAWIENLPSLIELLTCENEKVRLDTFAMFQDRTGLPKTLEINAHISNIVQYSATGDVKALFDLVNSGKAQLHRDGPPMDSIDVTPDKDGTWQRRES